MVSPSQYPEFISTLALTTQHQMAPRTNNTEHSVACRFQKSLGPVASAGSNQATRGLASSPPSSLTSQPHYAHHRAFACAGPSPLGCSLLLNLFLILHISLPDHHFFKGCFPSSPRLGKFPLFSALSCIFIALIWL